MPLFGLIVINQTTERILREINFKNVLEVMFNNKEQMPRATPNITNCVCGMTQMS